jgi:hypothetical protein
MLMYFHERSEQNNPAYFVISPFPSSADGQ